MGEKKQRPIKALINFRRLTPGDIVSTATGVGTDFYGNVNFKDAPPPPVDQATLKAATDSLVAANAAAINEGKKELQQQKHQKEVVVKLLIQLAHYVEAHCKDDLTIFLSTGFKAVGSTKSKTPPVSESVRKAEAGSVSGQILLTLMKFKGAGSYEVRWAPVPAGGGNPATWSSQPLLNVKAPAVISGLTPGTNYVFQARAVTKPGYTDWGQPLTKIAV